MKKIYLLLVAIIVVALVWAAARRKPGIIEKPEIDREYFETGLTQYKKFVTSDIDEYLNMPLEERKEYKKILISSANSAIKSYQEIIDKYPDSKWADDAQFYIAMTYFYGGEWDKAIEAYQKVITNYPEAKLEPQTMEDDTLILPNTIPNLHAYAQERIASIYYDMKEDYPQALIEYNKVIDKYPQDRIALAAAFDIERYCSKIKNYEPAIKAYEKLLKTRDNTPKDVAFFEKKIKELKAK